MNMMKSLTKIIPVITVAIVLAVSASAQTLTSVNGGSVDLQGQKGQVVILAIGASWVPLSADQVVITTKLQRKYAGKNVVVYFIATDSTNPKSRNYATDAQLKAFGTKNKLTAEILRDGDGAATLKRYAVDQLPSFVILDKNGAKSGETFSGIDQESDLSIAIGKAVDRLL